MDAEQAWQSALGQLQMEMPKASFDTWVRDTTVVSYDDGLFTIGVRNAYARDWMESRLSSTVVRLLMGIMNRSVDVRFIVQEGISSEVDTELDSGAGDHEVEESNIPENLHGSADYLTRYEKTVRPHRVVVVPGYLMRLLPERRGAAIFSYIGFSQVAWMNSSRNDDSAEEVAFDAPIVSIAKFSGSNRTAFYKLMGKKSFWESLSGLVSRSGDGFILHRTLPLTRADAQCVANWLKSQTGADASLEDALRSALGVPPGKLVGELLNDIYRPAGLQIDPAVPVYVPDIARYVKGEQNLNSGETTAALDLHARIVYGFKDLAIRHYFLTDVIRRALLSTDQAALVLAIRYRCFANPSTGEVVNRLLVPGGYKEMASWIGLSRAKSIWEWLSGYSREVVGRDDNKRVSSARTGGIPGFLIDITDLEGDVTRPAKVFRVRMLEPIGFEDSTDDLSWRTWDCDEDWKAYTVAMRQILPKIQRGGGKSPGLAKDCWSLDDLMNRAGVFPQVREKLVASGVDAAHFLAWILFCFSQKNTSNYKVSAYPAKRLGEDPTSSPGKGFERLSSLPPSIIRICVDATPSGSQLLQGVQGSGLPEWDDLMGTYNSRIDDLRRILFGN